MYERFYHLSGKPFSLLPDADLVFPSKRHRRALTLLDYGVVSQAGFMVVSGEVGAGKTTIVRHFFKNVEANITIGLINNSSASTGHLFDWIAAAFDIKKKNGAEVTDLYNAVVDFLLAQYASGKRTVLIIDEAQNLTPEMLEDLRMLSNVNNERDMLLQVVLVGQPELLASLNRPELRQFVQRITVHCHLDPLSASETAAYIRYRLERVGGDPGLFEDEAAAAVYHFSGGIPRLINLLCDQALVYGYSEDMNQIRMATVAEVAMDRGRFGLSAFVNVPTVFSAPLLRAALQESLDEIRQVAVGA